VVCFKPFTEIQSMTHTSALQSPRRDALRRFGASVFAVAAALLAKPSSAQEDGYDFKLFGGAAYVAPLSDSSLAGLADSVEASTEYGWEIGGEWKPSARLGLEVAYFDAEHDVEADGTVIGDIDLRPLTFTANFHLVDRESFNWYVGPTIAYVDWSDVRLAGGGSLDVDSETTYGVSTGIDIGLGDTVALQLGLRWLDAGVESPALPNDVSVDPLFTRVGIAFRF
jgi:outer membrane protein W